MGGGYLEAIYITGIALPHIARVSDETGVLFEVKFAQMLKNDPFTGQILGTKAVMSTIREHEFKVIMVISHSVWKGQVLNNFACLPPQEL